MLDARIKKLTSSLAPLVAEAEATHGDLFDRLTADLGCSARALAAALLRKATNGQALDLAAVEREQPLVPSFAPRGERTERGERGERSERGDRERRAPMPLAEGRVRCRTALGARDGIAARTCWARSSTRVVWLVTPSAASRCATASAWSSCRKMAWRSCCPSSRTPAWLASS